MLTATEFSETKFHMRNISKIDTEISSKPRKSSVHSNVLARLTGLAVVVSWTSNWILQKILAPCKKTICLPRQLENSPDSLKVWFEWRRCFQMRHWYHDRQDQRTRWRSKYHRFPYLLMQTGAQKPCISTNVIFREQGRLCSSMHTAVVLVLATPVHKERTSCEVVFPTFEE